MTGSALLLTSDIQEPNIYPKGIKRLLGGWRERGGEGGLTKYIKRNTCQRKKVATVC